MEIRTLTIDDYTDMIRLWSEANLPFKPKGRDSKEATECQIQAHPDFFLGALEGGRLVGTIIMSSDLRRGWINRLAVDPNCRRHGVAKALISEAEKTLRRHGLRIFCALIDEDNVVSRELFKKCGYFEHHDILYFSKRDSNTV